MLEIGPRVKLNPAVEYQIEYRCHQNSAKWWPVVLDSGQPAYLSNLSEARRVMHCTAKMVLSRAARVIDQDNKIIDQVGA